MKTMLSLLLKHWATKLIGHTSCVLMGHTFLWRDGWRCIFCNHHGRVGTGRAFTHSTTLH